MIVRVSASSVEQLQYQLETAATFGDLVKHVIVECSDFPDDDAALDYLRGALPLGARLLPSDIGASICETDAFGGRPVHLFGLSHACRGSDWGAGTLPVSTATDVYPIMRLSLDPRQSASYGRFDEHEHVDHLNLQPSRAALEMSNRYWKPVSAVMKHKMAKGAEEMLITVPHQLLLPELARGPRVADEVKRFGLMISQMRVGLGMNADIDLGARIR